MNGHYCFTISSLADDVVSIPVTIEFALVNSEVVWDYSTINVDEKVMFETTNLLVVVDLRDQWNQSVNPDSSSIPIFDEDNNIVGIASRQMIYNATLKHGEFAKTKKLYINGVNALSPRVKFYGEYDSYLAIYSQF